MLADPAGQPVLRRRQDAEAAARGSSRRSTSARIEFRVARTKSLEHGAEQALQAVEANEVPVVVSGDGLVGAIGGAMAGSETPLGIVPGGRGNDLARVLGIPDDPEQAVATVLAAGDSRRIDVGEVNGKRFLGIVSVGFDSECNRLANEVKIIRSNLVYVYSLFRILLAWKPARFTIRSDSDRIRTSGYSISVANNSTFGGGMYIAPDAELDDGVFDIITVGEVGKLRFVANLRKVFNGTHIDDDEVSVFRARHLELSASKPFPVYADGEHLTDLAGHACGFCPTPSASLSRARRLTPPRLREPAGSGVAVRRQASPPRGRSAPPAGPAGAAAGRRCPDASCCAWHRMRSRASAGGSTRSPSSAPPTARRRPRG